MSETIIAVLITGVVSILTTLLTAKANRDKMASELDKRLTVTDNEIGHIKAEMQEMKSDIREHNGYARMFAASKEVYEEKFKGVSHRLDELEQKIG
mgnify:CR=1 FL=1